MSTETVAHTLSLVVRFVSHFSGDPVPDELPVRMAGSLLRPVHRPGGAGRRQVDGSYRFIDVPPGIARVLWREPFATGHGPWRRWGDDPQFALPLADPARFADVELWPTAQARVPAAALAVRGRLRGLHVAGQSVRMALQGAAFDRFTQSDDAGEFLFLPPGELTLDASGRVPLAIEVRARDGTPRVVAGGSFVPTSAGVAFPGANFTVAPRVTARIVFQLL